MTQDTPEPLVEIVDALCAEVYDDWPDVTPECREQMRAPIRKAFLEREAKVRDEEAKKRDEALRDTIFEHEGKFLKVADSDAINFINCGQPYTPMNTAIIKEIVRDIHAVPFAKSKTRRIITTLLAEREAEVRMETLDIVTTLIDKSPRNTIEGIDGHDFIDTCLIWKAIQKARTT